MKVVLCILAVPICIIVFYALSKLQMRAWLNELEKFLNIKLENNEQTKEKK